MEAAIVTELKVCRITERLLDLCHDGRRRQRDRDGGQRHFKHSLSPPFSFFTQCLRYMEALMAMPAAAVMNYLGCGNGAQREHEFPSSRG